MITPAPGTIVLGFSAMFALLIVFAVQRVPGDERIVVEKPKIEARPDDIMALPKADREPIRVINLSTEPKPVDDATSIAPNQQEKVVAQKRGGFDPGPCVAETHCSVAGVTPLDEGQPLAARHRRQRDVCAKHSMHKVVTHGGRSWRCKR